MFLRSLIWVVLRFDPCHGRIFHNTLVHEPFDIGDLLGCQGGTAEIEGQFIGSDVRTLLNGIGTDHLVQRPVEQMGDGVMSLDGKTTRAIDG